MCQRIPAGKIWSHLFAISEYLRGWFVIRCYSYLVQSQNWSVATKKSKDSKPNSGIFILSVHSTEISFYLCKSRRAGLNYCPESVHKTEQLVSHSAISAKCACKPGTRKGEKQTEIESEKSMNQKAIGRSVPWLSSWVLIVRLSLCYLRLKGTRLFVLWSTFYCTYP